MVVLREYLLDQDGRLQWSRQGSSQDSPVQSGPGGLQEVAKDKRDNPPNKSPLLKVLADAGGKNADGEPTDESL